MVPTVASAIDLVVHLDLDRGGLRTVREVAALSGRVENGIIELSDVFHRDPAGNLVRGVGAPDAAERFNRAGHDLTALLNARPSNTQEAY